MHFLVVSVVAGFVDECFGLTAGLVAVVGLRFRGVYLGKRGELIELSLLSRRKFLGVRRLSYIHRK